ncbi:MAG: hypothetical protein NTX44_12420 [Ignavibacteriales bacterium]|nr:hypothetical protein [Ignavibacteriales bacterium]
MALLIVSFNIKNSEKDHSELLSRIEKYSNIQLSESSYVIITDKTPKIVCEDLIKFLEKNDNLYVITLKRPYEAYGSKLAIDWLNKSLTY